MSPRAVPPARPATACACLAPCLDLIQRASCPACLPLRAGRWGLLDLLPGLPDRRGPPEAVTRPASTCKAIGMCRWVRPWCQPALLLASHCFNQPAQPSCARCTPTCVQLPVRGHAGPADLLHRRLRRGRHQAGGAACWRLQDADWLHHGTELRHQRVHSAEPGGRGGGAGVLEVPRALSLQWPSGSSAELWS